MSPSEKDIMETSLGKIHVPGFDQMKDELPNKALCLQAMANLEIAAALYGKNQPTQKMILREMIRLGSNLSPTSQKVVNENIHRLKDDGHVVYKEGYEPNRDGGRGGPTSPWRTRYVADHLKNLLT